jgi:serine protease DegQ
MPRVVSAALFLIPVLCAQAASGADSGLSGTAAALPPPVAAAVTGVVSLHVRDTVPVPVFRAGRFHREVVDGIGAGSGVVISADGLILTNEHVVDGAQRVRVTLATGREVDGRVVSVDPASDLALVRAAVDGATPLVFAAEDSPPAGLPAYVIGNRRDRGPAVLAGRIGPPHTIRTGSRPIEFWRQVEAAVEPGDSGGALIDAQGRLLGMPTLQIASADRAGAAPTGLFIPARHLRRALVRLRASPRVVWPWLGLILDEPLIAAAAGDRWDPGRAPRVHAVLDGSPAARAGLRPGDRIVAVGDYPVDSNAAALDATLDLTVAEPAVLLIERDGARSSVAITPAERPADPRPDPVDDFALHTGLRLLPDPRAREERLVLSSRSILPAARSVIPSFEADLLSGGAALRGLLPGKDLLDGTTRGEAVGSIDRLAVVMQRCFVRNQFVALIHWVSDGGAQLDRAYVHRKIDPLVL